LPLVCFTSGVGTLTFVSKLERGVGSFLVCFLFGVPGLLRPAEGCFAVEFFCSL